MSRIGLIAGKGCLPFIWAKAARQNGHEVYIYRLIKEEERALEEIADQVRNINVAALDELINTIKADDIKELVMIGKVEKALLFQGVQLDQRMQRLLAGLDVLQDDNIMLAFIKELASEGIKVIDQATYIKELFPEAGLLTSDKPDEQLLSDMKYGFQMAREIGRLDIGQTVVVKNRAVLAVEAIEGTDLAIKRGGQLGGAGAVVAKVSKPQQDWRFDIPTIGETTMSNLIEIKARGLVIEAGKTFIIEQESLIEEAERHGIVIMAMEAST